VLDNGRLIDGTGAAPIEHGRILIQGDRIAQFGTTLPLPPDAEILDLSARTIVPGLIDLHVHIENDPKLALRQLSHGVSFRD
jgi:imidazolonepropionase-like amidohydrolase